MVQLVNLLGGDGIGGRSGGGRCDLCGTAWKEARSSSSYAWHPARHEIHRNCVIKGAQLVRALIRGEISGELIKGVISQTLIGGAISGDVRLD
jgi:hypothetical protein